MKKTALFIIALFPVSLYSQVETHYYQKEDTIHSEFMKIKGLGSSNVVKMPKFDLQELIEEDQRMESNNLPYRFGKPFNVSYSLNDGAWTNVDNGRLWTLSFSSDGAKSLNFVFDNFHLSEGSKLYIENQKGTVLYGPVTTRDVPQSGFFLTDIIPGDKVTIYLFEPSDVKEPSTLTIRRVVHGYRGNLISDPYGNVGASANCHIDVACEPSYAKESNAVALILLSGGTTLCSGSLLMSTDLSFKPYLLTAFHCADIYMDNYLSDSEISNAEAWMFKFLFKKTTCGGTNYTGTTYNSATFRAGYAFSDFLLMEINHNLKQNTSLTWLGWDKSGNVPSNGVCIQHPAGDLMKIAISDNSAITSSFHGYSNNGWRMRWNSDGGVTEDGSSGAPLLNQNKKVVGQVYGKNLEDMNESTEICGRKNTHFGKFNLSWTGDSTNDTRLSNWLDPIGTGQTTTDSSHPIYISGSNLVCRNSSGSYSVSNLPSGYTVTWSSSSPLSVSLQTSGNNCFLTHNYIISHKVTLTATLYRGSQMIRTVTKNVVCHGDIIIRYSQAATSNHPAIVNQLVDNSRVIMVTQNVPATITSANFLGMNVSCNYSSVASWNYDGNQTITFTYPSTGIGGTGLIFSASGSPNCNDFQVTALPYPSGQKKSILVNTVGNRLELSIVPSSDADNEQIDKNLLWTLNVYEVSTGRKIFSQDYNTSRCTVDFSGWKQGVYILQAVVGDEITYEKIKI